MKPKMLQKTIALTLATLMLLSVTACGETPSDSGDTSTLPSSASSDTDVQTSSDEGQGKVTTLEVLSLASNEAGPIEKWWNDLLREKIGVEVEFIAAGDQGDQKLQALTASGELPDLVVFKNKNQVTDAIRAKLLVNLDEQLEALPNVAKYAAASLQYNRDNLSADTGNAYIVNTFIGENVRGSEANWGPFLRWDLYKELGMPEVKTVEDYLPLLQQMLEMYPVNENGQKVYGFSLWKDWDGLSMALATQLGCIQGIDAGDQMSAAPFIQVDFKNGDVTGTLDPDSQYIRALKFYYEANQMGLIDPDSLTQRFETAREKSNAGRVLFSWWSWMTGDYDSTHYDADEPSGFRPVHTSDYSVFLWEGRPTGSDMHFGIGAASKKIDASLRLLNFLYDPDGLMEMINGPKDLTWTIDENGLPKITDEGWNLEDNRLDLPGGGLLNSGSADINAHGLNGGFIHPEYNVPISYYGWESSRARVSHTKIMDDWRETMGANSTIDYIYDKNLYTMVPFSVSLIAEIPDDIQQIANAVGDIVKTNSWLMVFAQDQAEFDSLYNDMVDKATGLGLDQVVQWSKDAYKEATEAADKYRS